MKGLGPRLLLVVLALAAGAAHARERPPGAVLVVGGDRDYPPYEFLDADGQPAGFNVDLTRAIAEVMGLRVTFRLGAWPEMRRALQEGRIDLLEGLSWSEERARTFDLAPHSIVSHAIFARVETPGVVGLRELAGRRVVVHEAGIMDDTLTSLGFGPDLVRTDTPAEALRRLASGEGDYAVVAVLPGTYIVRNLKLTNLVPVARNVASHRYGYAVRKGDAELLAQVTEGLAILKKTGRYDELRQRWMGVLEPQEVSWSMFLSYGAVVFAPLLVVLGGTVLWSWSLRREVAQRTASLAREVAERQRAMEELHLRQAQLVQADKMAALGVLVSGVAHEINNPTGYLLLNLPVLRDVFLDAAEHLDQRAQAEGDFRLGGLRWSTLRAELPAMLDEAIEGARRIKRIVEDLKDFARRDDAPRHEAIDLNAVAQAAVRLVDPTIRKATRRFEATYAAGLPRARGNGQRVEQVIVNLVLNACQALPDPGRAVRLTTRADPARGAVQIVVEDEGVGIPPEHLSRVTEPFFTTKRDSGGTGLGLSVSAGIVKEHGGTLEIRSTPGAGTAVVLALPAYQEAAA